MSLPLLWQRWLGLGSLAILPSLGLAGVVAFPFLLPLALVSLALVLAKKPWPPLPNWLENLLALPILGAVVATGGLPYGLLRPVANLLVLLAAVRLFGVSRPGRRPTALLLLAVLAVAGVASSTHPLLALYLLLLLALLLLAVGSLLPQELARRWGAPFPSGAVPWRLVGATCCLAALVAVPLFFLFPRLRSPFAAAGVGVRPVSGFREAVALHELGAIKNSRRPMLRVRFAQAADVSPSWLRFAGATLTHYKAGRWLEAKKALAQTPWMPRTKGQMSAEITLEQSSDRLFLPPGTTQVTPPAGVEPWLDGSLALRIPRQLEPPLTYQVSFLPEEVLTRPPGPEDLVVSLESPALRQLAREAAGKATKPLAQAQAVESYLQNHYRYSLSTSAPLRADPVEWFLFTARQGHCEFFASAMVLLLRTLGIPARLQTGFAGGQELGGGEFLLRDANAHAWVLAYVDGQWRVFDPTPPEGRPGVETGGGGFRWRLLWSEVEAFWDRWVLTFSLADQLELVMSLGRQLRQALPCLLGGLGAWAAALVLWRFVRRRRNRPADLSPLGKLLASLAEAAGLPRDVFCCSPPQQVLAQLLPRLGRSQAACLWLFQTHERVCYAGEPAPPSRQVRQAWREVLGELTGGKGPHHQRAKAKLKSRKGIAAKTSTR